MTRKREGEKERRERTRTTLVEGGERRKKTPFCAVDIVQNEIKRDGTKISETAKINFSREERQRERQESCQSDQEKKNTGAPFKRANLGFFVYMLL